MARLVEGSFPVVIALLGREQHNENLGCVFQRMMPEAARRGISYLTHVLSNCRPFAQTLPIERSLGPAHLMCL